MEYTYIAFVDKDDMSDYGIRFPCLPGCYAAARYVENIESIAQEALYTHLLGLLEEDISIPESRYDISELTQGWRDRPSHRFIVVTAYLDFN
jgi:predicted RNase H-like HicB family nuclease